MVKKGAAQASGILSWSALQSHVRYLPTASQQKIHKAFDLGMEMHGDQTRRSGEPYFSHPIAVAIMLANMHADADTIIAALLHDALEDTSISRDEIEEGFGKTVLSMIEALTKLEAEDLAEHPSLDEQVESIRKLFTTMQEDVRIMVIKLVDRLHNMQTVEFLPTEKQMALAQETQDVYVKIADRLSMREMRDELAELCLAVIQPDLLKDLLRIRATNEKRAESIIGNMKKALLLTQSALRIELRYERNRLHKLQAQLKAGGSAVTGVTAITVIFACEDISRCYEIFGALHQTWNRETLSFQDFINAPMLNGYRALHTTVILEDGTRIRCKIRTHEMDEYARKGITTLCFDEKAIGLPGYMSWGQRIASLSEDTTERSAEFWESLQSDILGDSITVHGMDDRILQLPVGSTALDGAFYFYGDQALALASVRVDGVETSFHTELESSVSLDAGFAKKQTVDRVWLQWAHTGLATAKIREWLSQLSEDKKISEGRNLLEEVMIKRRKGFLAEFEEKSMVNSLQLLGYQSLNEGFIAIAEGRIEPESMYSAIFSSQSENKVGRDSRGKVARQPYVTSFSIQKENVDTLRKLVDVYSGHHKRITSIRILPMPFSSLLRFFVRASFTLKEKESFKNDVESIVATHVVVRTPQSLLAYAGGVFALLFLWGIDPVIARLLVADFGVSPIDLTLIRFWSLTFLCSQLLIIKILRGELKKETVISLRSTWLWGSAAILVVVAWSTYSALQYTWPSHYTIPMTAAGLVLTSIQNAKRIVPILTMWILFALGMFVLVLGDMSWSWGGIMLTAVAVMSFTLFSLVSEKHKKQEHVAGRALQYFFILSLLCTLISLPLMVVSTIMMMSWQLIVVCILFTVFISGMPYYLYYYALSHKQIDFVLRYSFFIIFASVGGQMFLLGEINRTIVLASGMVIVGALIPLVISRTNKHH